eukprot:CAMPEP_0170514888 /NCGR_PEP_ID=MMETSP0209-20121228/1407_1 /TAXON_ID=665100 ORGANISM="Litonotus pictus, Strain P1" /NCGR_SAMPLE_ID=MMETSP0209 /ASSEMBLY_ACC=CAM_ASM_000301 /LENGTH=187 /DNA_ID=CAMNT_0010799145 /DNA_START=258 /DNA_END=818 /DNA_ORIENTATION=-
MYHPDNKSSSSSSKAKFSEITEAYEVLSDAGKKQAYDSLILGHDYVQVRFAQQKAYDHFSKPKENTSQSSREEEHQRKTKEMMTKLNNQVPVEEITKEYNKHRKRTSDNMTAGERVWNDIRYDYSIRYSSSDKFHLEKNYGDEYNTHNDKETISSGFYYDTKENDEFYSKSKTERLKLSMQNKIKEM